MLSKPVANHETLKPEFGLQQTVDSRAVLTCMTVVNPLILKRGVKTSAVASNRENLG